jgi:hypothetical protein
MIGGGKQACAVGRSYLMNLSLRICIEARQQWRQVAASGVTPLSRICMSTTDWFGGDRIRRDCELSQVSCIYTGGWRAGVARTEAAIACEGIATGLLKASQYSMYADH